MVDPEVRKKVNVLFRQWAVAYKDTQGLSQLANLSKQLPTTKQKPPTQYKVLRETEAEAQEQPDPFAGESSHARNGPSHARNVSSNSVGASPASPSRPVTLSSAPTLGNSSKLSKGKKGKAVKFNLEAEKSNIMQIIASSSVASTNLLNALQLINRETQRVSDNDEVLHRFETCKALRRQVLRYIQLVESDDWIGSLLSANDELVKGLTAYEILDKSLSDDSDSDAWEHSGAASEHRATPQTSTEDQLAGLKLNDAPPAKPPRPGNIAMPPKPPAFAPPRKEESDEEEEEEDEDDPFGDSNAVKTPHIERPGMTWKQV